MGCRARGTSALSSGAFRCEKHTGNGVRPDCLSDPKVVADFTKSARETAQRQQPHGMFAVGITDEAFLASRHKRDEVCFCDHCQRRFREWLQARYKTLAALNAQWGTSYASWDEVRGGRTEDVRGKANFAPFVDFRTFMTDVWVDGCKTITDAYHQVAPQTPVGHTNTFGADPFNGNDYWKLCTQVGFGWGQEYSEAIKVQRPEGDLRPVAELRRDARVAHGPRRQVADRPGGVPSSTTAGSATTTAWPPPTTSPGGWPCTVRAASATMPRTRWTCRAGLRGRWFIPACNSRLTRTPWPRHCAICGRAAERFSWNTSASNRRLPCCGPILRCWSRGANPPATNPSPTSSRAAIASSRTT